MIKFISLFAWQDESLPPTLVKLKGVCRTLTHNDVLAAVETFGKTKSVVLYRSREEVRVIKGVNAF